MAYKPNYAEDGSGAMQLGPSSYSAKLPGLTLRDVDTSYIPVQINDYFGRVQGSTTIVEDKRMSAMDKLGVLVGFAGHVLKPLQEKLEDKAFLTGMARAAQGEAMVDIAKTQPAITKIFGTSPLIQGAQAYTAKTSASRWNNQMLLDMDNLRTMNPEAATKYLVDTTNNFLSGDPDTDLIVRGEMVQLMPGVMQQQAKEHYAYLQETARNARSSSWNETAHTLDNLIRVDPDVLPPNAISDAKLGYLSSIEWKPGENVESWKSGLSDHYLMLAAQGKFHVLNTLEGSEILDSLTAEQRTDLFLRRRAFEDKAVARASLDHTRELAEFNTAVRSGEVSADDATRMMYEFNDKLKDSYGFKEDFFDAKAIVANAHTAMQAVLKAETAMFTRNSDLALNDRIYEALSKGTLTYGSLLEQPGVTKEKLDPIFLEIFNNLVDENGAPDLVAQARFLARNSTAGGYVSALKKNISEMWVGADDSGITDQHLAIISLYGELVSNGPAGKAAIENYFNPDVKNFIDQFKISLRGNDVKEYGDRAFNETRVLMNSRTRTAAKDTDISMFKDNIVEAFGKSGWLPFSDKTLTAESLAPLMPLVAGIAYEYRTKTGVSIKDAASYAVGVVRNEYGVESIGTYAFQRSDSQIPYINQFNSYADTGDTPLSEDVLYVALDKHAREVEKTYGASVEFVYRVRDKENGEPVLMMSLNSKAGYAQVRVPAETLLGVYRKTTEADYKREQTAERISRIMINRTPDSF